MTYHFKHYVSIHAPGRELLKFSSFEAKLLFGLGSVHCIHQSQGVKKRAFGADDVEAPTGPVFGVLADLLPQFMDGDESLRLGAFEIMDFDPRVVDDLLVIVHEVEEAAHLGTNHPLEQDELC